MKVQCENCPKTYNMKPRQASKYGMFKLCFYCRKNPPLNYLCLGKTAKREKCRNIKAFGSQFCISHRKQQLRRHSQVFDVLEKDSGDFTMEEIKMNLSNNNELLIELNRRGQEVEDPDEKEEIRSWVVHYVQENCHLINLMEYKLKRE